MDELYDETNDRLFSRKATRAIYPMLASNTTLIHEEQFVSHRVHLEGVDGLTMSWSQPLLAASYHFGSNSESSIHATMPYAVFFARYIAVPFLPNSPCSFISVNLPKPSLS